MQRWVLTDEKIEKIFISESGNPTLLRSNNRIFYIRYIIALFVCLLSFFRVFSYYIKQIFTPVDDDNLLFKSVILGVGRGYDDENINSLFNVNNSECWSINAFCIDEYMRNYHIKISNLISVFFNSVGDYYSVLSSVQSNVSTIVLKNGIINISTYTYLKAFFINFSERNKGVVVYSAGAPLPSYAAISAKLKTIYLPHGLIDPIHLNCCPEYDSIYVYSQDEKEYLIKANIRSKLHIYPTSLITNRQKTAIIFMPTRLDSSYLNKAAVRSFLNILRLFNEFNYDIYLKVHPLTNASSDFFKEYNLESIHWDDLLDLTHVKYIRGSDGASVIKKLRPNFVISWASTALCESLNMGIVPITMFDQTYWDKMTDVVYPIEKRSLIWLSESNYIKELLRDNIFYEDTIQMLRQR
jgi:hypothetical protein